MKTIKKLLVGAGASLIAVCLSSCGDLGGGGGGGGGYEAFSSGRCGACSGSGQTFDHNRGVYETCYYCGGRGQF